MRNIEEPKTLNIASDVNQDFAMSYLRTRILVFINWGDREEDRMVDSRRHGGCHR